MQSLDYKITKLAQLVNEGNVGVEARFTEVMDLIAENKKVIFDEVDERL